MPLIPAMRPLPIKSMLAPRPISAPPASALHGVKLNIGAV
jgi:hypothetical protein